MKKQVKKLALSRETLTHLENSLGHVAGAATALNCSASCPDICTFSGYRTCNTCGATCGTNLC